MEITCTHCHKRLQLADDKVPARAFTVACPGCQGKIRVDPAAGREGSGLPAEPDSGTPHPDPPAGDAPAAPRPADGPDGAAGELPPLRPQEEELLSAVAPVAFLVRLGRSGVATSAGCDRIADGLRQIGMRDVRQLDDLEQAVADLIETDASIVVVVMDKAPPPPCEPLRPLEALPYSVRRRTLIALVARNVTSLDGMVAFLLQVNCLINAADLDRLPLYLRRALLHQLRLYRHWSIETD